MNGESLEENPQAIYDKYTNDPYHQTIELAPKEAADYIPDLAIWYVLSNGTITRQIKINVSTGTYLETPGIESITITSNDDLSTMFDTIGKNWGSQCKWTP